MDKIRKVVSEKLLHFSQFIFLTFSNFNTNNLWESASSCSFGFVFSFMPVSLIIVAILTSIVRIFPEIEIYISNYANQFSAIIDIEPLLSNITKIQHIHFFDIFLSLWVIWMARKLFSSILIAMNKIFRKTSKRKTTVNQLISFISEFFLVLAIILVIIASFTINKILKFSFFETARSLFPMIFSRSSNLIFSSAFYILIFILSLYFFKIGSGTKPKMRLCIFYSLLNTFATFVLSALLNSFLNTSNYNIIYGTISALIILMLKVYFFFVIFLFIAQMIFVSQFFDTLILNELYLLPDLFENRFFKKIRRILFINPVSNETSRNTVLFNGGETIFDSEDSSDFVYFICQGFVTIANENEKSVQLIHQGSFIGETNCILGKSRGAKAIAQTQCRLIKISREDFFKIINASTQASKKAMKKITREV